MQDIFNEELKEETKENVEGTSQEIETCENADVENTKTDSNEADVEASDSVGAEEICEEVDRAEGPQSSEKKGFFQKKADKRVTALEEKVAELEDKTKRQMAEFDNFRKRTDKEKAAMFETGAKSVIEKILPVIDNFERGLATVGEDNKDSFYDGMNMIYKQMLSELEKIGVTPIEAVGKEFDPNFHNAVMQVESEEYEEGIVAQELLKGYMYRDTVVRHSMVAVVQ